MEITIPERFLHKLEKDRTWLSNVFNVISNVENYYFKTPFFFPEYTDHGIRHEEKVLGLCDELIVDSSLEAMSTRDLAILIIAVMTHDIGMFIEKDGLHDLLFGKFSNNKMKYLDNLTWNEAWKTYISEAQRYPDKKLVKLFGEAIQLKIPPEDMQKLDEKDKLIYGDFLRQYHPRLSHEMLINGFIGSELVDIFKNITIDSEIKDIIGLITRSHGMELRDTSEFINRKYISKNIAFYYLMIILRIADYLDAGEKRAPHIIEAAQQPKSATSREEFEWNQVIKDYKWETYKETLTIHAKPTTSSQFIKIESWLNSIQKELDLSWAILGEYYRFEEKRFLTIRRIDSNILNSISRAEFSEEFSTRSASLGVNPDLLKLLIGPLYSNDPTYGVRELIQNAVDACNERQALELQNGVIDYEGEITINIDSKKMKFTIIDNGIGMDEDTIINYYLVAGSSFRNSDFWYKNFVQNNKPTVARTGKFGIGVLSTFLIGNSALITTREINDKQGYQFNMMLDQDVINIKRTDDFPIGTTIEINLNKDIIDCFYSDYYGTRSGDHEDFYNSFNWYHFKSPKIDIYFNNDKISNIRKVPDGKMNNNSENWFSVPSETFTKYFWRYELENKTYCNGIFISKNNKNIERFGYDYGFEIKTPTISIIDYNNDIKINLSRTKLLEIPDERNLLFDIYKYALFKLITFDFNKFIYYSKCYIGEYDFIFSKNGYSLYNHTFILHSKIEELLFLFQNGNHYFDVSLFNKTNKALCINIFDKPNDIFENFYYNNDKDSFYNKKNYYNTQHHEYLHNLCVKNEMINFGVDKNSDEWDIRKKIEFYKVINNKLPYVIKNDNYYYYSKKHEDENEIVGLISSKIPVIFGFKLAQKENRNNDNIMLNLLKRYMGDEKWIPYDLEERKKKFPLAFEELQKYMVD